MPTRDLLSGLPPAVAVLLCHGVAAKSAVKASIGETHYRRLLHSGILIERPGRILMHAPTADLWTPLAEAQLRCPGAVGSHRFACWAHGAAPFDGRVPRHLDLIVPGRSRLIGAHEISDLRSWDVITIEGLKVTTAARTLADLGALVGDDIVERVGERMLYEQLVFESDLYSIVAQLRRPGRTGIPALERFLEQRGRGTPPTESDLETRFMQVTRRLGFPEPTFRQYLIHRRGQRPFRVDFAYRVGRYLVLVEIDGLDSHIGLDALVNSDRRQNVIVRGGCILLRFTSVEIDERPDFIDLELGFHVPKVTRRG